MYSNPQRKSSDTLELRREVGRWLKARREARGLSQRQFAETIGADYYTFVSQLETGRGRIPPDKDVVFAAALGMNVRDFVLAIMPFYDPVTFDILFPRGPAESEAAS